MAVGKDVPLGNNLPSISSLSIKIYMHHHNTIKKATKTTRNNFSSSTVFWTNVIIGLYPAPTPYPWSNFLREEENKESCNVMLVGLVTMVIPSA